MILVDTSVWVDHLRKGSPDLASILLEGRVFCHPFVIGELTCGGLKNRAEILSLLAALPQATVAGHDEAMGIVHDHKLHGKGLGSGHRGPVLKRKVDQWLRRWEPVLAFVSARQADGGTGAAYVLLRK